MLETTSWYLQEWFYFLRKNQFMFHNLVFMGLCICDAEEKLKEINNDNI